MKLIKILRDCIKSPSQPFHVIRLKSIKQPGETHEFIYRKGEFCHISEPMATIMERVRERQLKKKRKWMGIGGDSYGKTLAGRRQPDPAGYSGADYT